jgi:hypothetical protein
MNFKKILLGILLLSIVASLSLSTVSAWKHDDMRITVKVGETVTQGTQGYDDIIVKPQGDARTYVNIHSAGKNKMQCIGLKTTPAGKTADFEVGTKIWGAFQYIVVHVTVNP